MAITVPVVSQATGSSASAAGLFAGTSLSVQKPNSQNAFADMTQRLGMTHPINFENVSIDYALKPTTDAERVITKLVNLQPPVLRASQTQSSRSSQSSQSATAATDTVTLSGSAVQLAEQQKVSQKDHVFSKLAESIASSAKSSKSATTQPQQVQTQQTQAQSQQPSATDDGDDDVALAKSPLDEVAREKALQKDHVFSKLAHSTRGGVSHHAPAVHASSGSAGASTPNK
ncbi:MAG: hypothetical protein ABSE73_16315 [Planctomycetota bacterium]